MTQHPFSVTKDRIPLGIQYFFICKQQLWVWSNFYTFIITTHNLTLTPVNVNFSLQSLQIEFIISQLGFYSFIYVLQYSDEIIRIFIPRLKLNAFVQVKLR